MLQNIYYILKSIFLILYSISIKILLHPISLNISLIMLYNHETALLLLYDPLNKNLIWLKAL